MPSTRCGSSSATRRSSPSVSEYSRRHSTEGSSRPAASSAIAASSAARRTVPFARATVGSSPSSTRGSRANSSARRRSSPETGEASATELLSATEGVLSTGERRAGLAPRGKSGPARLAGPSFVFTALPSFAESGERAESIQNDRRTFIIAHQARIVRLHLGQAVCHPWVHAPDRVDACGRLRPRRRLHRRAARASRTSRPPPPTSRSWPEPRRRWPRSTASRTGSWTEVRTRSTRSSQS